MSTAELAASYAAIILADDGVDITVSPPRRNLHTSRKILIIAQADKLNTLIKAANVVDVEPIWASLMAKVRTETRA
jgi:large subunit ribosomal protein LP1